MNITRPSLYEFEEYRKSINYIPPKGSNSFYTIGAGEINILSISSDILNLFTHKGNIITGSKKFIVGNSIYKEMNIITGTSVTINKELTINNGKLEVHGSLIFDDDSVLNIVNNSNVIFYSDSVIDLLKNGNIKIDDTSSMTVYGQINVDVSLVDVLYQNNIILDSASVMNVKGIEFGKRCVSLTDYETILRDHIINVHTQGESNSEYGRIGYIWTDGSPANKSQVFKMTTLYGEVVLGDFKLSVLGLQEREIQNKQVISDILVKRGSTLYIGEYFKDYRYIRPTLYLGVILGNCKRSADCTIEGTVIADGVNSSIIVDRGATVHINKGGELYLQNGCKMISTNNDSDDNLLFIDGTLIIDNIEQINTFTAGNIVFGEYGKVKVLNPDTGERKLLFTTPNGIQTSDLYKLFKDEIDHIEYHISNNTGIGIDQYFDFYAKDMKEWFGGRRIEKAIHDGILVWHDGGFIELNNDIIPWADVSCTLLEASRIFKSFGSYDNEKLQEVVERLTYVGCGNIVFRFIQGYEFSEVTLVLEKIKMKNVINKPMTDMYVVFTDNDGELFIKDKVQQTTPKHIISEKSKQVHLSKGSTDFQVP